MKKLSIIIPAYNEEKRIENTLIEFYKFFNNLKKDKIIDFEILIVINNTTDKTEEIVKKVKKGKPEILYLNFKEKGKGFAVIEGFKDALKRKNDLIGFVDADLATSPKSFYDLVKKINNHSAIIASRYIPGAIVIPRQSIQRIISSRIFNVLIRSVLQIPFRDTQCGAKLFKREAVKKILPKITMSQWAFDAELLYNLRKQNYSVKEIPTIWSDKEYSTINFAKAGPFMALSIIRLRLLNSPLKDIVRLYNKISDYIKTKK